MAQGLQRTFNLPPRRYGVAAALLDGLGLIAKKRQDIVAQFPADALQLHFHGSRVHKRRGQQQDRCQQERRFHRSDE